MHNLQVYYENILENKFHPYFWLEDTTLVNLQVKQCKVISSYPLCALTYSRVKAIGYWVWNPKFPV